MRLWSIHPKYLDRVGLVALWREALLAQKVLREKTKGYRNHPQLKRFRDNPNPLRAIASYLIGVWEEARRRGYNFDKKKIGIPPTKQKIPVTRGQLKFEFDWLCHKLKTRDFKKYCESVSVKVIEPHRVFRAREGEIEEWEKMGAKKI